MSDLKYTRLALTLALSTASLAPSVHALDIFLNANQDLLNNSDAYGAFRRAADTWEDLLDDDIPVTIDAGISSLGESILGGTFSYRLSGPYQAVRDLVVYDEISEGDLADPVVSYLPNADSINYYVPDGFGWDGSVQATKANFKALGLDWVDDVFGPSDGEILFSSDFAFDYDNTDGVADGFFDFETVAFHEIGHLLGFSSDVDRIDYLLAIGDVGSIVPTILDLFRFPSFFGYDPTTLEEFATFARIAIPGVPSHFDTIESSFPFSTGVYFGDGSQASHWKDNLSIGVMDPTLAPTEISTASYADLLAMDVIGWSIRPVPDRVTTSTLLAIAFAGLVFARKRNQTRHQNRT